MDPLEDAYVMCNALLDWIVYGTANVVTSFLNVYWFGLMLRSLRKRFPSKSKVPHKTT